jgi:hypothetical protein
MTIATVQNHRGTTYELGSVVIITWLTVNVTVTVANFSLKCFKKSAPIGFQKGAVFYQCSDEDILNVYTVFYGAHM